MKGTGGIDHQGAVFRDETRLLAKPQLVLPLANETSQNLSNGVILCGIRHHGNHAIGLHLATLQRARERRSSARVNRPGKSTGAIRQRGLHCLFCLAAAERPPAVHPMTAKDRRSRDAPSPPVVAYGMSKKIELRQIRALEAGCTTASPHRPESLFTHS